jgi:hypothetical protein
MTDIAFKYAVLDEVEVQPEEGGRYSRATVISRIPCEPEVLYRVKFATSKKEDWATEGKMRPVRK